MEEQSLTASKRKLEAELPINTIDSIMVKSAENTDYNLIQNSRITAGDVCGDFDTMKSNTARIGVHESDIASNEVSNVIPDSIHDMNTERKGDGKGKTNQFNF